jgi:hypothetical protein
MPVIRRDCSFNVKNSLNCIFQFAWNASRKLSCTGKKRRHRSKELKRRIIRGRGDRNSNKWRATPASRVISVFVDMVTPSVSSARTSNCISFSITWRIEDVLRREGTGSKTNLVADRVVNDGEQLTSVNSFLCACVRSSTAGSSLAPVAVQYQNKWDQIKSNQIPPGST